jgi:hypothetical protein
MSTASNGANPAPATVTVLPGGPLPGESTMPGLTVKLAVLAAVPPGVVTAIGPLEAARGIRRHPYRATQQSVYLRQQK